MNKVKIHPSFIVIWLLFLLSDKSAYILFLFLAAAIHETAHITAFLFFKAKIGRIDILPFGISVHLRSASLSYSAEIASALAGPLANCATAFLLSFLTEAAVGGLNFFMLCNCSLAAINLLPIYPLDGGRAFYYILCKRNSTEKAKTISLCISIIFLIPLFATSVFLLFYTGYNFSLLLIVLYLFFYLIFKKY